MIEAALLGTMQLIIRDIKVDDDFLGNFGMHLKEQRHQKMIDLAGVGRNLLVAVGRSIPGIAEFKAVQLS